ncbi:hypothetical protein DFH06DRAFT_1470738 [Mycena polygramma]|nr:hypothetical protein DFH06DRAFT_1470738 [Mycena polygramma]
MVKQEVKQEDQAPDIKQERASNSPAAVTDADAVDPKFKLEDAMELVDNVASGDDSSVESQSNITPEFASESAFAESFAAIALEDFGFAGEFSCTKEYAISEACNPCLCIDGIGQIGLPLSEREARSIISVGSLVVIPGKDSGRNSGLWEVLADKVHFANPAWAAFEESAGLTASRILTGVKDVSPVLKLSRLSLHEQNHISQMHRGSQMRAGLVYGVLVIILPSLFEGGPLETRWDVQSKTYEVADKSGLNTRIFAAPHSTDYRFSSVTSGYRLMLEYDILEPTPAVPRMPFSPDMHGPRARLKATLLAWKENRDSEDLKYWLQNAYPRPRSRELGPQSLIGPDALLAFHARQLAEEVQLEVYLLFLSLTTYEAGLYETESSDDTDISVNEERFNEGNTMGVDAEDVAVTAMDMDGNKMSVRGLDLDALRDELEYNQERTSHEWERDTPGITLTERYERAILVIEDPSQGSAFTSRYNSEEKCRLLLNSTSTSPTIKERKLIDRLVEGCEKGRAPKTEWPTLVDAIRCASERWSDINPLLRILRACRVDRSIDRIGLEELVSVCSQFGWGLLRDFLEDALLNDGSNQRRQFLLGNLRDMANKDENEDMKTWCHNQEDIILLSLRPVTTQEVEWRLQASTDHSWEFVRDVIFPQLCSQDLEKSVWLLLLQGLTQADLEMRAQNDAVTPMIKGLITECVTQAIDSLHEFPTTTISEDKKGADVEPVLELVKLCIDTNNTPLCGRIADNLAHLAIMGECDLPPWLYYLELCRALETHLESNDTPFPILESFFIKALDEVFSCGAELPSQHHYTTAFTTPNLSVLMRSLRRSRGISLLKDRLMLHHDMFQCHKISSLVPLGESVAAELKPLVGSSVAAQDYGDVMSIILRSALRALPLTSLHPAASGYDQVSPSSMESVVNVLNICLETGEQVKPEYLDLLQRLLPPPSGVSTAKHVAMFHTEFATILHNSLTQRPLALQEEFRSITETYLSAVTKAFAREVMGQRPQDRFPQVAAIGCAVCADCKLLRQFLYGEHLSVSFPRPAAIRRHLEDELSQEEGTFLTLTTQTIKTSNPHTFKVTKPASMTRQGLWAFNSQTGKALLALLGDVSAQRRVLAGDYDRVTACISELEPAKDEELKAEESAELKIGQKRLRDLANEDEPVEKKRRFT